MRKNIRKIAWIVIILGMVAVAQQRSVIAETIDSTITEGTDSNAMDVNTIKSQKESLGVYQEGDKVVDNGFEYLYYAEEEYDGIVYEAFWTIIGFHQQYDEEGKAVYRDIVVPETYQGIQVAGIEKYAFANQKEISSFSVKGDKFKVIGYEAFSGCTGLKKAIIPASTVEVSGGAFYGCKKLSKVRFKGMPEHVEGGCFEGTKWVNDCTKKGIATISNNKIMIDGRGLKGDVVITGDKVEYITGRACFGNKKITSLKIDGVKKIDYMTFMKTGIKALEVKNVKEMDSWVFSNCKKLKRATLNRISKLDKGTLGDNPNLEEVHWGMSTVGEQSFRDCVKLKRIYFSTKKKIKWPAVEKYKMTEAFENCKGVHIYLSSKKISKSIKYLSSKSFVLHVPPEAVKKCQKLTDCKVVAWRG